MWVQEKKVVNHLGHSEVIFNFKQKKYESGSSSPNKRSSNRVAKYDWNVIKHFSPDALAVVKKFIRTKVKAKRVEHKSNENSSMAESESDLKSRSININDLLRNGRDSMKNKRDLVFKTIHFWKRSTDITSKG